MTKSYHLRLDVAGAIRNKSFAGLTDDKGTPLTKAQARDQLRYLLATGVEYIPVGECNNFVNGMCQGHEKK